MTAETIEGEAVEVEPIPIPRALTVAQPGNALVSRPDAGPATMIAQATALASALRDIVERQKLYATISGKKFPQVEAWMTIGRMDNVVAREAEIIRHEDGSYEAAAELVRLSDGMVIGRGSALCGTKGDRPWDGRPEPVRRSMAVTRATSRAFRQQYSWIMALAGYEPTPADEMPHEARDVSPRRDDPDPMQHSDQGLIGTVAIGKAPVDMETRQTPDGPAWGFKLAQGRRGFQALATGTLAEVLAVSGLEEGTRVTVWGRVEEVPWEKNGKPMPPYLRVHMERVQTPEWTLPAEGADLEAPSLPLPMEPLSEDEKAAIAGSLA